jgi:acetolactate synthase-1/2/3 large subunit
VLVLGSRLGEFTSFWQRAFEPPQGFIHVDLEPDVFGAAYPQVPVLGVHSDIGMFLEAVLDRLADHKPAGTPRSVPGPDQIFRVAPEPSSRGPVRPSLLMDAIQRILLAAPDVSVITDAGHSFVWGPHLLRATRPLQYRTSTGFGSMGHAAAGVVGAALARHGKAVAILGDGAMLINTEISTAVAYGAKAVWVVLNDGRYGMVEEGMKAQGFEPVETGLPPTDFVLLARSVGAEGVRVTCETELEPALQVALAAPGPFVVDVTIDRSEAAPIGTRIASLDDQGGGSSKGKS